jgi:transmembrane sensor
MSERAIVSNAREIDARAAQWIERRDFGDWSDADQAELDSWLAESVVHRVAFVRLDTGWRRAERLVALRPFKTAPVEARAPVRGMLIGIAAALAAAALLGVASTNYVSRPSERVYSTAIGGLETVKFADGSQIELNTDTVLRARMTSAERIVWVDKGEAYFQIKHDPARPFAVVAGGHRVTDIGTKFLVRRDTDRLEVALVEGRVRFGVAGSQLRPQSKMLTPGDDVVATAESIAISKKSAQELASKLAWRRGVLVFKDTALADAVRDLDRYNSEKLVVADPAVAGRTISGTIPTNDVEGFIRVVRGVLGLHVQNDGNEVVITR